MYLASLCLSASPPAHFSARNVWWALTCLDCRSHFGLALCEIDSQHVTSRNATPRRTHSNALTLHRVDSLSFFFVWLIRRMCLDFVRIIWIRLLTLFLTLAPGERLTIRLRAWSRFLFTIFISHYFYNVTQISKHNKLPRIKFLNSHVHLSVSYSKDRLITIVDEEHKISSREKLNFFANSHAAIDTRLFVIRRNEKRESGIVVSLIEHGHA